ncbi:hypothetical protein [Halobaculum rarum]|uniref:hypothetical protein n=1 Tax=Halobaculum rarum TaxID=3075122 RepID=UPI0032AF5166
MSSDAGEGPTRDVMELILRRVREEYREEHVEDPPGEFLEVARRAVLRRAAGNERDAYRQIYEELADE